MQSEIYNIGRPCAAYWTRYRAFSVSGGFGRHIRYPLYTGRTFALHRIGQYAAKPQKVTRNVTVKAGSGWTDMGQ